MKRRTMISFWAMLACGAQGFAQDKNAKIPEASVVGGLKADTARDLPASPENARDLTARLRLDWISLMQKTTMTSSTRARSEGFQIQTMDLTFVNRLANKASLDIRLAPVQINGGYAAESASSGVPVSNLVEHAWLEYKLDKVSVRVGKLDMVAGAVEYMEESPFDYYLTSYFNNASNTIIPTRSLGVSAFFHTAGQTIELQVTNGMHTDDIDINGNYVYAAKGGVDTGLAWHGDLGAIKPIVSIAKITYAEPSFDSAQDGTTEHHEGTGRTLMGVGATGTVAETALAGEYDTAIIDPFTVQTGAIKTQIGTRQNISSFILSARHSFGTITPLVKVTIEQHKKAAGGNAGDIAQNGVSLGAEYAVTKEGRFHLVYNRVARTTTKGGGIVDKKDTTDEVICGAALKI